VIAELVQVRGIGRWTAEMFLIFCLLRPNVLAAGRSWAAARHLSELFSRPVRVASDDAQACLGLGSLAFGRNLVSLAQPRSRSGRVLNLGRPA